MHKVSELGRVSKKCCFVAENLYRIPIINIRKIEEVSGLSREAANQLVDWFVKLRILAPKDKGKKYGRLFVYKKYLNFFDGKE